MRKANYRPSDLLRGEAIPDDILAALPKTDLHCHLDGSLRLDTFVELARESEMDVPDSPEGVVEKFFPRDRVRSQHEFLKYFDHTLAVLQDERNLRRVARERAEQEHSQILEDARVTAERIKRDAASGVEREVERAKQALRDEAADLAVELAGKLLQEEVTDADRARLVGEFVAEIETGAETPGSSEQGGLH